MPTPLTIRVMAHMVPATPLMKLTSLATWAISTAETLATGLLREEGPALRAALRVHGAA